MKEMKLIYLLLLFLFLVSTGIFGQTRQPYFDERAEIILPENYNKSKEYPLLVFLPYTTGTSRDFLRGKQTLLADNEYIILLPAGRPQRDHYLPDFRSYIAWYEESLFRDINDYSTRYSIDRDKIVLAGFSLGGDLSWALAARNPGMFAGIVISGTRCSYPLTDEAAARMRERDFRVSFFIGQSELLARSEGMQRARDRIDDQNIEYRFESISGGHTSGPDEKIVASILWILEGGESVLSRLRISPINRVDDVLSP